MRGQSAGTTGNTQPAFVAGGMASDLVLRVANLTSNLITIGDAGTIQPVEINAALRETLGWSGDETTSMPVRTGCAAPMASGAG